MTVSLRGTREVKENHQLFRLTGLLDAFSEPTFTKEIGKHLEGGPKDIILDLTQINFIDSSGLGALVKLAREAQNAEGSLKIIPNARVRSAIKLVRLDKFLSMQPEDENERKEGS